MPKKTKVSTQKISQNTHNVTTIIFLFSLIIGIVLTTYLANAAMGQNVSVSHAAELQK
jgi:uncharacterized membrane protein affecting hemolysin expression